MRVALVHELLTQDGGAEAVFQAIAELFPNAPIFTTFYYPDVVRPFFKTRDVRTAYVQTFSRIPYLKERYHYLLPLLPHAIEHIDLSSFDVVISSSSGLVKSVIAPKDAFHICYCHSPARYLWVDSREYIKSVPAHPILKLPAPYVLDQIRAWDRATSNRPHVYVANSAHVQKRIRAVYNHESEIVHPFVEGIREHHVPRGEFFLAGGRLVGYKRFDLIVKAFNKLAMPLVVFGTGPEWERLRRMVKHNRVTLVGKISDQEKWHLFDRARAFIHPQEEDFGITMLESLAAGTPVIAFARGGALEALDTSSAVFFDDQSWEAIANAVIHFDESKFDSSYLRSRAGQFSKGMFQKKFMEVFNDKYQEYKTQSR